LAQYKFSWVVGDYGTFNVMDRKYFCHEASSPIKYSIFEKSTWGYRQLEFVALDSYIIYQFRLLRPFFSLVGYELRQPMEGVIDVSNCNPFEVAVSLFHFDRYLQQSIYTES